MDPRVERTQQLFWEVESLRPRGVYPAALPQLLEMARLHEERALDLLRAGDPDGWADLFAAVTAWGEARRRSDADRLLVAGRGFSPSPGAATDAVEKELRRLEAWLDLLPPAAAGPGPNGTGASMEAIREKW